MMRNLVRFRHSPKIAPPSLHTLECSRKWKEGAIDAIVTNDNFVIMRQVAS